MQLGMAWFDFGDGEDHLTCGFIMLNVSFHPYFGAIIESFQLVSMLRDWVSLLAVPQ